MNALSTLSKRLLGTKLLGTKLLGAAALSAAIAIPAAADLITPGDLAQVANKAGNAFTPTPIAGDANGLYSNLTFRLDDSRNVRVSAGQFVLDYKKVGSNQWNEFYAFCLQPDVYLWPFSNPYGVDSLATSGYNSSIGELWGRHYSSVSSDLTAAAFQVAIWELAYDGDGSLDTGSFKVLNNAAVKNLASQWIASIDGTGPQGQGLAVLGSNPNKRDRQDLITQVPEPGPLALLAIGLLAIGIRRKIADPR